MGLAHCGPFPSLRLLGTEMKKFKIDLTEYNVTVSVNKRNEETNQIDLVTEEIPYPIKINLYQWLRMPGMFKGGV